MPAAPAHPGTDSGELIAQILAGQHSAFGQLMQRHNRGLYRAVRSILRDDQEAEDALQEAWLDVYRGLPGFRGQSSLSTWLTRIAINAALARRRKQVRAAEVIGLWADQPQPGEDEVPVPDIPDDSHSPEQEALRGELRTVLEQCIDQLPDQFRTVFVLRALEDMSSEEVAAAMGIPESTARTRFFRARAMLRESLAREVDVAESRAFGFDGERCARITARVIQKLEQLAPGVPPSNPSTVQPTGGMP